MVIFLLECGEDEERHADLPSKEAFQSVLETTASYTNGAILTKLLVSNNTIIVFQ